MRFKEWLNLNEVNHFYMNKEVTLLLPDENGNPKPFQVSQIDMKFEKYHPPHFADMVNYAGPAWQVKLPFPHPDGTHLIYDNGTGVSPERKRVFGRIGNRENPRPWTTIVGSNVRGRDSRREVTYMSPIEGPEHWWQRAEMFNSRNEVVFYLVPAGIPYDLERRDHFVKSHRDEWLKNNNYW